MSGFSSTSGLSFGNGLSITGAVATGLPVNVVLPALSAPLQVGVPCSCSNGTWTNFPTLTFAWTIDGTPNGATGSPYTPVAGDAGHTLDCVVTATNGFGSANATATGSGTVIVAAPTNTVSPNITGGLVQGTVQTAHNGTWTGSPTFTRQWVLGAYPGSPIGGATAATYTPTSGQVGQILGCIVTGTNAGGALSVNATGNGVITAGGGGSAALQFNVAANSMYIPLISARDNAVVTSPSIPVAA